MDLTTVSGLVLRLETDRGLSSEGNTVTAWRDTSGSVGDLIVSGDPSIGTVSTPTGAISIELDGDGDKFEALSNLADLPTGNSDRTVFFVVDYEDPQGVYSGVTYGRGATNKTFGLVAENDGELGVQGYGAANDVSTGTDGVAGGFLVQSAVLDSNELRQYADGTLLSTDTHSFNTVASKLVIGGEFKGSGFGDMNISAVLVYDRALSETERADVEAYLQEKYISSDGSNNAPFAIGETQGANSGETSQLDVLSNDVDDAPLDGTMINIIDGPDHGTYTIDPITGLIAYTHDGGSSTTDSITYTLTDAGGATSQEATLDIEIGFFGYSLTGFQDEKVLGRADLNTDSPFYLPVSMTFLPDNRMLLVSKDGEISIVDPETGNSEIFMSLSNIDSDQERGLLDITLDPDFETNGHFYLYYTPNNPENARISRFTYEENAGGLTSEGDLSSEFVVWEDTDGYLACCHYGGGLDFGPDNKLWLTTSDKFQASTPGEGAGGGNDLPIDLASTSGKIIRVNKDGTVPDGTDGEIANPFIDPLDGVNDFIWAYGLRNPFRARWDEEYENLYIGEVGGNQQLVAHDDVHISNLDHGGAFYGWPFYEGENDVYVNANKSSYDENDFPLPDGDPAAVSEGDFYSSPIWSLDHEGESASLTGGEVYRGDMFPENFDGVYFYGDYTRDYIRYIILDETGTQALGDFAFKPSVELPGDTNEVVSIVVGEDGALYYGMIASGDIHRITYSDGVPNDAVDILTASITPGAGALPSDLTFNATVSDPNGDAMTYSLNFGDGTVVNGAVVGGVISVNHTYASDGRYDISLSVSDGTVTSLSNAFEFEAGTVNEAPDIVGANSSATEAEANVTELNFTATASDLDGDALTYTWHFGDGNSSSGAVPGSGNIVESHIYTTDGTYDAFLEVFDGTDTTQSSTIQIEVGEQESSDIPVGAGLVLNLQSDIKIGLGSGNEVVAWLDGSGQGNNLFAGGNPTLEEDKTPTGQSAIVFDGSGDKLERVNSSDTIFNLPTGSADRTMFLVVNYIDDNRVNSGVLYGDGQTNEAFGLVSSRRFEELNVYGSGVSFDSNVDAVSTGWMVQSVVLDDNAFSHYQNGTLIDSGTHAFNTDLQTLIIGGAIDNSAKSQMEVAATFIYDRALSETERQQIEDFLQDKYITGGGTTPTGNPPVAQDDSFAGAEDTAIVGDVLADNGSGVDSDPDLDTLTTALVTDVSDGTLVFNTDGSFTYTPDANFFGVDSFTYEADDGNGGTDTATVTLNVAAVDDPAVAQNDSYTLSGTTPLVVNAANGVLANDSDAEGDAFTASFVSGASDGTLNLSADGSFTYTPGAGFSGSDSFTYQITGGDTATVTISDAPDTSLVTAGLVAAYESDENVSLGAGNTVTGWLDGSGRGNDLLAGGDPTLVAGATPTGESAIVFDGTDDLLQRVHATDSLNGLVTGGADRTMFFVVNYLDHQDVAAGLVYGNDARNKAFGLVSGWNDEDLTVQAYARDFDSDVDAVSQGWMVQSVVLDDNSFDHYLNGGLIDSGDRTFKTTLETLIIGGEIGGLGESQLEVGAALIYDRALDESEREEVETYLQQKYIADDFIFA